MSKTTHTQKRACQMAASKPWGVDKPPRTTAEALVRRGYAVWNDIDEGTIQLNAAGQRLARTGETIEWVREREQRNEHRRRWFGDLAPKAGP